jgi:hypothetical protein
MLQQRGEDSSCEPKNVQRIELESQSVLEPNPIASAHSPGHSWASEPVSTISSRNSKADILRTVQDILDLDVVIQTMHCNVIAFYATPLVRIPIWKKNDHLCHCVHLCCPMQKYRTINLGHKTYSMASSNYMTCKTLLAIALCASTLSLMTREGNEEKG